MLEVAPKTKVRTLVIPTKKIGDEARIAHKPHTAHCSALNKDMIL